MAATSVPRRWKYDVFVSFRGEDIRRKFMDHLFKDFRKKGIHAFRDDDELPRGEEISLQLYKAIEESRVLIVIFSKDYASSSWCLKELVKILECKQIRKHEYHIRIIFYDVKPAVVRNQTDSYAKAFTKHEFANRTEVAGWKEALVMAANFSGWDLQEMANGYESKFIDTISKNILKTLRVGPLHVGENLVGVDTRVRNMNLLRFVGSSKVHMIGICGIGGIGKTTLAKAIYNLMYIRFEECIFMENVREFTKGYGLTHVVMDLVNNIMKTSGVKISNIGEGVSLIKQSMKSRRILLVLDDVDHHEQLEALAGSCDWFYPGSLIVFTSRDKQLLTHKVDEIHDVQLLDYAESLELFCLHAFHEEHPTEDFEEIAKLVVQHVQGHPLALKVAGCSLFGTPIHLWKSELDRLRVYPDANVYQVLQLTYDGLNREQQNIFLDIAFSFVGVNINFVASVLDSCNYFADSNIRALIDKSLITISCIGLIQMHALIQGMAREIVRKESPKIWNRSRLWIPSDVYDLFNENKATKAVEVLDLLLEESGQQQLHIDSKAFAHMTNLRILKICDAKLGNFSEPFELERWNASMVNYSGRLEFLSNTLRLLYWHGCPFKFFPSDFYPVNIVAIDLSYSHIKNLWTTSKNFTRLKVMKLMCCRNLTRTPDFTKITNLEELNLEGCENLVKVHPSFGMLKGLVVLNMRNCKRFRTFPCKVELDSLEVMNLSGCTKVNKLPNSFDKFHTLKEVFLDGTAIMEPPPFLCSQRNLQKMSIGPSDGFRSSWWTSVTWQRPKSLVLSSLAVFCFLIELDVSRCNILEVPDSIGRLSCLGYLDLDGNNFTRLPGCLSQLSRLRFLRICGCKKLEVLPELPPNIAILDASHCTSLQEVHGLLNHDSSLISFQISGQSKWIRNFHRKRQVSMSQPRKRKVSMSQPLDSSFSSLARYMHIQSNVCHLQMLFHGNRIPQWFTSQSMGNSIRVDLPPNWCYLDGMMGYGICFLLTRKRSYTSTDKYHELGYSVKNSDGEFLFSSYPFHCKESKDDSTRIRKSDMIWLTYSTSTFRWDRAKNFVTISWEGNDVFEVKACGVRFVYEEDIEEESGLPPKSCRKAGHGIFRSMYEWFFPTVEDAPPFKKIRTS